MPGRRSRTRPAGAASAAARTLTASTRLAAPSNPSASKGRIAPTTARHLPLPRRAALSMRPRQKANSSSVSVPVASTKPWCCCRAASTASRTCRQAGEGGGRRCLGCTRPALLACACRGVAAGIKLPRVQEAAGALQEVSGFLTLKMVSNVSSAPDLAAMGSMVMVTPAGWPSGPASARTSAASAPIRIVPVLLSRVWNMVAPVLTSKMPRAGCAILGARDAGSSSWIGC
jgi:hypothetical protein